MIILRGRLGAKAVMKTISRRDFLERSLKFAALTGFSGPWFKTFRPIGQVESSTTESCDASLDSVPDKHPGDPYFGVQTHFGQFRPGVDDLLDLIKASGAGWIRDEAYWSQIEKEKGVFKFPPAYDLYLKVAQTRGLQVLLILDFGNALYSGSEKHAPATADERQAFARYCREVVTHCAPLGVRHYEVWNEPNSSTFWRPQHDPEAYARLLETAFRACKEADPGAIVLGCSTAGVDLDFIGRVVRAGGARFLDGVSFHPYCQPLPPERKLLTDIPKVIKLVPDKPLWITEFGYPTHAGADGVDEETQSNYLVRAFLLARCFPAVKGFCWYDFQNDGEDPDEGEFNFGLVRLDRAPKPAYAAYRTMTSLVGDLAPGELRIEGGTYVARFGEGEGALLAVWRSAGSETVEIPCPTGPCRIIERDGQSRTVEAKEPGLQIDVSEKPRYILPAP